MPPTNEVPSLSHQTVLITGAAQGLGRALAIAFAAAGAQLLLVDLDEKGLAELAATLPRVTTYTADLSNEAATRLLLEGVQSEHPRVHTLIHNAGFLKPQPFAEMPDDRWRLTFNVGIQAAWLLTRSFWADWLVAGGTAIYVSSRSGIEGFAGEAAYCATKHAIEGFVKALAIEGEPSGILLHAVTPGRLIHTPMSEQNYTAELKQQWAEPAEFTAAFLYLAERRDPTLSGQRLDAWAISQQLRDLSLEQPASGASRKFIASGEWLWISEHRQTARHPERSKGPAFVSKALKAAKSQPEVLCFAQDDSWLV